MFVEEMGTNTSRSLRFIRLLLSQKREKGLLRKGPAQPRGANTTTLLASMSLEGMGPCLAVQGPMSAAVFEAYSGGQNY